jgi:hypothetical protein
MEKIFLFFLTIFCISPLLWTQAGPVMAGQSDIHFVNHRGEKETITFYPDVEEKYQFYYFPTRPRLATQVFGGLKDVPMFQFIKYNFDTRKEQLSQGGILQFGVTLALPEEILEFARAKLSEIKQTTKEQIQIAMVPITSGQATFLTASPTLQTNPGHGRILGNSQIPRHPGGVMSFVVPLNPENSTVYEKLTEGALGIGVSVVYSYEVYTPAIHCKITGTWENMYRHYSQSESARLTVARWVFGGSIQKTWQDVKDDLQNNCNLRIEWNPRPDEKTEQGKKLIQLVEESLLLKIAQAVFEQRMPDPNEKLAQADTVEGLFGGLNYSLCIKDIHRQRRGRIGFSYLGRTRIELKDRVDGFVSVANVSDEFKRLMFLEVQKDEFFNALKIFCRVAFNPQPFRMTHLKYVFQHKDVVKERLFVAKKKEVVPVDEAESRNPIVFATGKSSQSVEYHVEMTIQQGREISTVIGPSYELSPGGYSYVTFAPEKMGIEIVEIDLGQLTFCQDVLELIGDDVQEKGKSTKETDMEPKNYPKYVTIKLTHGKRQLTLKGGVENKENGFLWPVVQDRTPVKCEIIGIYEKKPQKRVYYRNKETDLREGASGLKLILNSEDFEIGE